MKLSRISKIVLLALLIISAAMLAALPSGNAIGNALARGNLQNKAAMSRDLPMVLEADLPKEARATLTLIAKGGPFPYSKDGVTFSNRERALSKQPRGYYREYTVKTPGAKNRGARRIVCGTPKSQIAECYYTDDHYATFRKIKP